MPHRRSAGPRVVAEHGLLSAEIDPARPSGRLLRQAGMEASYTDLADPRHLEFDYLRWMQVVLLAARARRVLHVGGAGCALPRALAAADPAGRQEVYEIDAEVVAFARAHLGLRRTPGLRVRVGDGTVALAELAATAGPSATATSATETPATETPAAGTPAAMTSISASFVRDAVVIDAFIGARVAPGPSSAAALANAATLAPLTLINVVDDRAGREVARIATALGNVHPRVWTVAGRSRNTVLGADRGGLDLTRLHAPLARDRSPASLDVLYP